MRLIRHQVGELRAVSQKNREQRRFTYDKRHRRVELETHRRQVFWQFRFGILVAICKCWKVALQKRGIMEILGGTTVQSDGNSPQGGVGMRHAVLAKD